MNILCFIPELQKFYHANSMSSVELHFYFVLFFHRLQKMSAPYTSPPSYDEAQYYPYNNPGYNTMNDPMSPAMVAAVGRPTAAWGDGVYNESSTHTNIAGPISHCKLCFSFHYSLLCHSFLL